MKSKGFALKIVLILYFVSISFSAVALAQNQQASPSKVTAKQEQKTASAEDILKSSLTVSQEAIRNIWETAFVLLIGYALMFFVISIINSRVSDIKARHMIRKNFIYFVSLSIIVIVFFIWIQNLESITIFLGVASAGLALALQEVIMSIAGWLLILFRRPFSVGDRIEINGVKGDVIDIRLFQTSLLEIGNWVNADQSTGRIVNIPNSFVFKSQNYNYSRGFEFIWNEIPILLTFESDWKRGREIIMAHARKHAEGLEDGVRRKIDAMRNRYMIYYGKLTPIVYVNIKDSGVELTLRYLTEAKKRRSTQDQLCQAILDDIYKEENVNFAYPTYRIVKN